MGHYTESARDLYRANKPVSTDRMECTKCNREAVLYAPYSGAHLCEQHFRASVERRVRQRIREDALIPADASPDNPQRWLIGLSGGKDSAVLTTILAETFMSDPRIELTAVIVHEGIAGYRDESVAAAAAVADDLGINVEQLAFEEEFGIRMDEIAANEELSLAPCAYCGTFRRDLLKQVARDRQADKLLTGHNLDDEAETALMNVLEGDIKQMAKHYTASLAPFDERPPLSAEPFVPRAKPLRDVPEREVALYAQLRDLPVHIAECPHAERSFRAELQEHLHELEEAHPGTRHSIMAGYETMAKLAAGEYGPPNDRPDSLGTCEECGTPTDRDRCRTCELLPAVGGTR